MTDPPLPPGLAPGGRFDVWAAPVPRLVVADVDGTIVGPAPMATPAVVTAVERLQAAGLRFGFATGRMRLAVDDLQRQLHARGPHVLHNGAEVRLDGRTVAAWPLEPDQVRALLERCAREGWYAELYTEDGFLVTEEREAARPHWELLGHQPLGRVDTRDDDAPIFKATVAVFDGDVATVEGAVTELGLRAGSASSPLTPGIEYVNATHPEADKGRATAVAAGAVGLGPGDVVAVGDGRNDLSVMAWAGTAIAMGQAALEIRAAAHVIAPTVAEDGLAQALDACVTWAAGG